VRCHLTCLFAGYETAAYMQAMTPAAVQLKRTTKEELRRLIHESGIVIARERLRLLDVVGQGIQLTFLSAYMVCQEKRPALRHWNKTK